MSKAVDPEFKNMKGCTELTVFRIEAREFVEPRPPAHPILQLFFLENESR